MYKINFFDNEVFVCCKFEELRLELNDNKQKLSELREALGLDALKEEIAKLEEQTAAEEFWGRYRKFAEGAPENKPA